MKCRFVFVLLIIQQTLFGQNYQYNKHWVQFTNKEHNPFVIEEPENFLSSKSVERRSIASIPITEQDLPVTPIYVDSVKNTGVKLLNKSKWLNGITIESMDSAALAMIQSFPFVSFIEPIAAIELPDSVIQKWAVDESAFPVQKNTPNQDYGEALNQINMLNGDYLHRGGFQGNDMLIAVIDAGFYRADEYKAFDSVFNNNQVIGVYDFVDQDDSVFAETSAHGMNVFSTMASNLPGKMVGTAPKANYLLLRTEDSKSEYRIEEYNWVAAAEYADSIGAGIINSSLSYSTFTDTSMNYTYSDMDGKSTVITKAAAIAAQKGMLVVVSAGNAGNSIRKYIAAPADADRILTIGAVNSSGEYVGFSSVGPTFDQRVKPDLAAQGSQTAMIRRNGIIGVGSGTSFSAPIIAGLAACFWQAHPDKTAQEIIAAIKASASLKENPNDLLGFGLPDFKAAHLSLMQEKGNPYNINNTPFAYPNPFSENLQVVIFAQAEGHHRIAIYDEIGKELFSMNPWIGEEHYFKLTLNQLDDLQSGVYFLKINTSSRNDVVKLVKY